MNINFNAILAWVGYFLAAYLLIIVFCYLVMLLVALYRIKRNTRYERPMDLLSNNEFYSLGVSVLVPAYNEESGIIQNVSSLLNLNYKEFEIIVINDGSQDATADVLIEQFSMKPVTDFNAPMHIETAEVEGVFVSNLFPNLMLVNKANGGKADALNLSLIHI